MQSLAKIYNTHFNLECISSLWEFIWCHSNYFQLFTRSLFNLLAYFWLIITSMDYLCIPHTIAYTFNVISTVSDLLWPFSVFIDFCNYIDLLIFWLFIISVDCTIIIGLDFDFYGLLVIFDPSNVILIFLTFKSPQFDSDSVLSVFRLYPLYINLDLLHYTLISCIYINYDHILLILLQFC